MTLSNEIFLFCIVEIYDDTDEDHEEIPLSTTTISTTLSSTIVSNLRTKSTPNITAHLPAQTEEGQNGDYADGDDFESYQNEDNQDAETANPDDSQVFDEKTINDPNRKNPPRFSTARIPFVPSNLWRDLFTKPGILVGKCFIFSSQIINSSFRYYRRCCYWNALCYLTCYVYYLSNA